MDKDMHELRVHLLSLPVRVHTDCRLASTLIAGSSSCVERYLSRRILVDWLGVCVAAMASTSRRTLLYLTPASKHKTPQPRRVSYDALQSCHFRPKRKVKSVSRCSARQPAQKPECPRSIVQLSGQRVLVARRGNKGRERKANFSSRAAHGIRNRRRARPIGCCARRRSASPRSPSSWRRAFAAALRQRTVAWPSFFLRSRSPPRHCGAAAAARRRTLCRALQLSSSSSQLAGRRQWWPQSPLPPRPRRLCIHPRLHRLQPRLHHLFRPRRARHRPPLSPHPRRRLSGSGSR